MARRSVCALLMVWVLAWCRSAGADFVPPWLTGESRPSDLTISLATMGPGDEVHQYFGHTALEVRDRRLGVAALYNFGMFGFDGAFLLKFLKGKLEFWVGVQDALGSYQFYAEQDRDVRIAELDLPPETRAQMARDLAVISLPENRTYLYHHYRDNCATRIVDAIDKATGGEFKAGLQEPVRLTFRDHTRRYAAHDPIIDWLLIVAMNDSMEQPLRRVDELFLPGELERAVLDFRRGPRGEGPPLVKRNTAFHTALTRRKVYDEPPTTWPYTLAVGSAVGAVLAALGLRIRRREEKWARVLRGGLEALLGGVFGLLGTLLTVLALFTEHTVTYWNENLFFVNPLTLMLLPLGIGYARGAVWAARWHPRVWVALAAFALLGLLGKLLPNCDQENTLVWTLLVPPILAGALSAWRFGQGTVREVSPADRGCTPSASA